MADQKWMKIHLHNNADQGLFYEKSIFDLRIKCKFLCKGIENLLEMYTMMKIVGCIVVIKQ